jgi:hypothetical protein
MSDPEIKLPDKVAEAQAMAELYAPIATHSDIGAKANVGGPSSKAVVDAVNALCDVLCAEDVNVGDTSQEALDFLSALLGGGEETGYVPEFVYEIGVNKTGNNPLGGAWFPTKGDIIEIDVVNRNDGSKIVEFDRSATQHIKMDFTNSKRTYTAPYIGGSYTVYEFYFDLYYIDPTGKNENHTTKDIKCQVQLNPGSSSGGPFWTVVSQVNGQYTEPPQDIKIIVRHLGHEDQEES